VPDGGLKIMDKRELNNVISAFKTAHREKDKIHVSDNWQMGVMNLIRNEVKNDFRVSYFDLFQKFVWRLAPITCVLALMLGILLTRIDILSDYEMVKFFINDPSDLSFISQYDR